MATSPTASSQSRTTAFVHADHPGLLLLELDDESDEPTPPRRQQLQPPPTPPPRERTRPPLNCILARIAPELELCSQPERAFILRARAAAVIDAWAAGITSVAGMELLLRLILTPPNPSGLRSLSI